MNIYFIEKEIRKQYLRFVLAVQLGNDDAWDWVNNQNWEMIISAKEKLQPHFDALLTCTNGKD